MSAEPVPTQAQVPPQDPAAEEHVLGAMLLSPGAVDAVSEILDPADFYRDSHAKVYRAALDLRARGFPVDAVTVADDLDFRGELDSAGGRVRVHELAALVPASANAAHYARIVREMALLRGLIRAGGEIARLGWERAGEARDLVDRAEQVVFDLGQDRGSGELVTAGEALRPAWQRLVELSERGGAVIGCPSGYEALDRLTAGFQPGNLVVLAARPSIGKSACALGTVAHVALHQGEPVALFTLEMNRTEVIHRLMASEALVDSQRLRSGRLTSEDWQRLSAVSEKIDRAPLLIDDSSALTMHEIRSRARRAKLRNPALALVVVDYLQLMSSGQRAENRVQEVSQISRSLKVLAGELDVPVLALSQLSRLVEQRHDKRPILSDLRESGAIEADADVVAFIYRDDYYNAEDPEEAGVAEINVAKQRNGPTGTVKLSFRKEYARFGNLEPS